MTERDKRFTEGDWAILQESPFCSYLVVASSGSRFSNVSAVVLVKVFEASSRLDTPAEQLFKSVMSAVSPAKEDVMRRVTEKVRIGATTCLAILHEAAKVLDTRASAEESYAFKANLIALAYLVASHSKLFSKKLKPHEAAAINEISLSLGVK